MYKFTCVNVVCVNIWICVYHISTLGVFLCGYPSFLETGPFMNLELTDLAELTN